MRSRPVTAHRMMSARSSTRNPYVVNGFIFMLLEARGAVGAREWAHIVAQTPRAETTALGCDQIGRPRPWQRTESDATICTATCDDTPTRACRDALPAELQRVQ